jgi:hypothetical protein
MFNLINNMIIDNSFSSAKSIKQSNSIYHSSENLDIYGNLNLEDVEMKILNFSNTNLTGLNPYGNTFVCLFYNKDPIIVIGPHCTF